jgi:hypothetical protein
MHPKRPATGQLNKVFPWSGPNAQLVQKLHAALHVSHCSLSNCNSKILPERSHPKVIKVSRCSLTGIKLKKNQNSA